MDITEQITTPLAGRVDRANGVIHGVKLIGFTSRNGRTYPSATLRGAVHLYEGVRVNIDHPQKPHDSRSVRDRIGVIKNARFMEGVGILGDFHFNPNHALADQIAWDAENNPESAGFSHNANLILKQKDGKSVVEEIRDVRHVDLVADPATTSGFFESVQKPPVVPLTAELMEARLRGRKYLPRASTAALEGKEPANGSLTPIEFSKRLRGR
ncbi:MAG: hypothetical protein Fues2KO_24200 [Fuerstiella sp.]